MGSINFNQGVKQCAKAVVCQQKQKQCKCGQTTFFNCIEFNSGLS